MIRGRKNLAPRIFRTLFALSGLVATVLVWSLYWMSINFVERVSSKNLLDRVSADSVMIEDHFTRSMDVVTGILRATVAIDDMQSLFVPSIGTNTLTDLVINVPVIRSISLVDSGGKIVASSSLRNVGVLLPPSDLPTLFVPMQPDEIKFGEVFALRDFHELNSDRSMVDIGFWTAQREIQIGGRDYRWLIAINLGLFQNLWDQVDTDEATTILLVDKNGRRIASHHLKDEGLASRAIDAVINRDFQSKKGTMELADSRLQIAFLESASYPGTIIVTGDPAFLAVNQSETRNTSIASAAVANALLLGFIALLFALYLRYEKRVLDLVNQSRAVDMHLMVAELNREGMILDGNDAFFATNGYVAEELVGQPYTILSSDQRSPEAREELWAVIRSGKSWTGTLRNRKKSGEYYWVNVSVVPFLDIWGNLERIVTLMTDITESVALAEIVAQERRTRDELISVNAALVNDANTDPMTGQPNRRAFEKFFEEARAISARDDQSVSLLMLDVDYFKRINDTHGHHAGDVVLRTLAQRWSRELRSSDMLARLGGEEFCVVLPRTGESVARRIAEKLRAVIAAVPVDIAPDNPEAEQIAVTVSIGVATTSAPASITADTLLDMADAALYEAKRNGRNRVV